PLFTLPATLLLRRLPDLHSFPTRRSSDLDNVEYSLLFIPKQMRLSRCRRLPYIFCLFLPHTPPPPLILTNQMIKKSDHLHQLDRSEEHTSELSHVSISYAVFCLKKKNPNH